MEPEVKSNERGSGILTLTLPYTTTTIIVAANISSTYNVSSTVPNTLLSLNSLNPHDHPMDNPLFLFY